MINPKQVRIRRRSALRSSPTFAFTLLLLLLLAFSVRLYRLDAQSIWWDEGISLRLATSSLPDLVANRLDNIHPPLYFMLLKGWVALTGVNAFSARYLSVLASWLLVPAVYGLLKRWFGVRPAWVGAGLAGVYAVSVIYAQEIRVYAMLPLIFVALLFLTGELVRSQTVPRRWLWPALGGVVWLGLHLHYIAAFAVAYVALWGGLAFLRRRRLKALRWLVITYVVVGLASLPWFLALLWNSTAVQAEANAGTYVTQGAPLGFLLQQVWGFHLTGLAGALNRPGLDWLVGATAVLLALLLAGSFWMRSTRRAAAALLSHWWLPLASALIVWQVRSFSHPRYVTIFTPGLLLLAAYLIVGAGRPRAPGQRWLGRAAGLLLTFALVLSSLAGLWLYYFDSDVAKDDIRGAARVLEANASPDDLILVPDTDWSLPFEYQGQTTIVMPRVDTPSQTWEHLEQATTDKSRAFMLDYTRGTRDWQEVVAFALERAGRLEAVQVLDGVVLRTYALETAVTAPELTERQIAVGPLLLSGVSLEQDVAADSALTLALRWQLVESTEERLQGALRLVDMDGNTVATADDLLLDAAGRPTDAWSAGQIVTTYHLVPLPPGTPPLAYTLALGVYANTVQGVRNLDVLDAQGAPQGQSIDLGEVRIMPVLTHGQDLYGVEKLDLSSPPLVMTPGLELLATSAVPQTVEAGRSLQIELLWRASNGPLPYLEPRLSLEQAGQTLVTTAHVPVNGRYPTSRWELGEWVREQRTLLVPPEADGQATLVIAVGPTRHEIGALEISATERRFSLPPVSQPLDVAFGDVARLVGYDLPAREVVAGTPIELTLYWEALSGQVEQDYTVFTHLLDANGRLIAQHDAPPDGGRRPTRGWVAGEFIVDSHTLAFRDEVSTGPARIEVGLYDPVTGDRLTTPDGADHFILPDMLTVRVAQP